MLYAKDVNHPPLYLPPPTSSSSCLGERSRSLHCRSNCLFWRSMDPVVVHEGGGEVCYVPSSISSSTSTTDHLDDEVGVFDGAGDDEMMMMMKKVAHMRSVVEPQDPDAKAADNLMLRRFLHARDLDVGKASSMFLKYLKWKRGALPKGFISESQIRNELAQKKVFMQGCDKQQRPIAVFFGARHFYSKRDMGEFKRFIVYVLEKLCSGMTGGQEKFICIGDLQGWGYSNSDIRAYLAGLDIMQNYYPERLGKFFLIHVPYVFMKAWKIIYPFIDKNTRKKFIFVEDTNLKATLLKDIDENQLPEMYGGKLPLCPVGDSSK